MKKTISTNRLTIDLTNRSKKILENLKLNLSIPFGTIVNNIISTFCDIPEDMKTDLIQYCKLQINDLSNRMSGAAPLEFENLSRKRKKYINIITFLNKGISVDIDLDITQKENKMKKNMIKDGYILYPEDWILLNPEDAMVSRYAIIVECRNSQKYRIPHFLFFTNADPSCNNKNSDINNKCIEVWPEFKGVLDKQVTPITDPVAPGILLNKDEWQKAPIIGYFNLYEQGDPDYPEDYEPPLGAKIVRNTTQK